MKYHWMIWLMMIGLVAACDKPTASPINTAANSRGNPVAEKSGKPAVGSVAMEIEADDLDGKSFKLSDYRGKVVVLDFWGDW